MRKYKASYGKEAKKHIRNGISPVYEILTSRGSGKTITIGKERYILENRGRSSKCVDNTAKSL